RPSAALWTVNCWPRACPAGSEPENEAEPLGWKRIAPIPVAWSQKLQNGNVGPCAGTTGTVPNGAGRSAPYPGEGPKTALPLRVGKESEAMRVPGLAGSKAARFQPVGASMLHQRLPRVSTMKAVATPRPAASLLVSRTLVTRFASTEEKSARAVTWS